MKSRFRLALAGLAAAAALEALGCRSSVCRKKE
jgi:hypothetical protein